MISFNLNYTLKILSSKAVTLELRASTYDFGVVGAGNTVQSVIPGNVFSGILLTDRRQNPLAQSLPVEAGFSSSKSLVRPPVDLSLRRHAWSQTGHSLHSFSCVSVRDLSTRFGSCGHHLSSLISVDCIYLLPSLLEK